MSKRVALGLGSVLTGVFFLAAQVPLGAPPSGQQSGMASGGAHHAVRDAQHRPITAGGFVDGAPVVFTDLTKQAGLDKFHHRSGSLEKTHIIDTPGSGVALLDYDHDGWLDIYLLNGSTVPALKDREPAPHAMLLHNNRDGTFSDVTDKAGVSNQRWGFGVAVADYDKDGWPDIYIANFGKNRLYHNNRDGTFADVSVKAGVSDRNHYYGLASVFIDVDNDGWLDLVVANDSAPNYLYRNGGNGTFEDLSYLSGFAVSGQGYEQASMGIALGDYDRDGKLDLYLTSFSDDYNPLYPNEGGSSFTDVTAQAGILEPTILFLGWGTVFLDFDNDGLLDLFVANGHVYRDVDQWDWGTTYAQRPQLFRNHDGKKFQEVPPATDSGLADVITGRGAAFGDLFNDGHIDVVTNNIDSTPTLLRNVVKNGNHWITLQLVGGPKSPRDGIGAKVFLTASGATQRADVFSGGSYGSSSDPRVHFGVGSATKIDKLEIHWPSGSRQQIRVPGLDRILTVTEAEGV